jgi:hypothetical protein
MICLLTFPITFLLPGKPDHSGLAHDAKALNFGLTVAEIFPGAIRDPRVCLAVQAIALDAVSSATASLLSDWQAL